MIRSLIVILLVFLVSCGDQVINMYAASGSGQPTTVVRQTPIMVKYNLLKQNWSIFPDLHDKFYLETAQRVKFFYTITIWPSNFCPFWTIYKIDGKQQRKLNFLSTNQLERTHTVTQEVWLEKGEHTGAVWYWTLCNVNSHPANNEGSFAIFGLMEIQYLKYP